MDLELVSLTVETIGTLMIAFAALRVHDRVLHEHNIDKDVFKAMKLEQRVGVLGAFLVVIAFIINTYLIV